VFYVSGGHFFGGGGGGGGGGVVGVGIKKPFSFPTRFLCVLTITEMANAQQIPVDCVSC
jgi:hypothetical protein